MNVLDSELVAAGLLQAGYELVDSPRKADTILFNTCSVRQHAEDKIYSALGRLKHAERPTARRRSSACWAAWPRRTRSRSSAAPRTSTWSSGPGQLHPLAGAAGGGGGRPAAAAGSEPRPHGGQPRREVEAELRPLRSAARRPSCGRRRYQAMVRIMFGCDKFCTYCIVPQVRGPEQSRPAAEIVAEVRRLADRRLPGGHAAGPDGQQLPGHQRRPHVAAGRPAGAAARDRRAAAAQVRDQLSAAHDRRPAAGGPRFAQGLALSARAGPERLQPRPASG